MLVYVRFAKKQKLKSISLLSLCQLAAIPRVTAYYCILKYPTSDTLDRNHLQLLHLQILLLSALKAALRPVLFE